MRRVKAIAYDDEVSLVEEARDALTPVMPFTDEL